MSFGVGGGSVDRLVVGLVVGLVPEPVPEPPSADIGFRNVIVPGIELRSCGKRNKVLATLVNEWEPHR